ncbi:imm11 family protein [Vibrio harveyi]|uniref:imm11 family protein n=1 Tax=Vibrio harveyi TaxID=669 RepID=UPI002161A980|nr:DUF1629 domain-containing protein [Vibrio harveyi]
MEARESLDLRELSITHSICLGTSMAVFSKVFVVTPNVNEFALLQESSLALSIQETERKPIQLYGEPVKASWKCVDVEWLEVENEKALPKPDIAAWRAISLAMPISIADQLGVLCEDVEFLPLCLNKQSWRAVNILTQLDAIDHSATKFNLRDGKQSRVRPFKKLVLKKKAVNGAGLFRVQGAGLRMFCTDKKGGLYERVHELGLTGLSFKEIQLSP